MFFTPEPSIQHLILLSSLSPPDSRGPCLVAEAFCQVSFFKYFCYSVPISNKYFIQEIMLLLETFYHFQSKDSKVLLTFGKAKVITSLMSFISNIYSSVRGYVCICFLGQ